MPGPEVDSGDLFLDPAACRGSASSQTSDLGMTPARSSKSPGLAFAGHPLSQPPHVPAFLLTLGFKYSLCGTVFIFLDTSKPSGKLVSSHHAVGTSRAPLLTLSCERRVDAEKHPAQPGMGTGCSQELWGMTEGILAGDLTGSFCALRRSL